MIDTSSGKQRRAFSWWLRTGRLPPVPNADGIELKFNPWHDPADGQFTFAGSGRNYGTGGAGSADRASGRAFGRTDRGRAPTGKTPEAEASRAERTAIHRKKREYRSGIKAQSEPASELRIDDRPNPVAEFIGGVGEGVYDVGKGAVTGAYSALTTNPVITVRNVNNGVAGVIDRAIAAEDTPARVQVSRAAAAVANASPRELGRATGSVVGNAALAVAPGAALGKVAVLRRIARAIPRESYAPPQVGWVRETLKSDKAWRAYNDAAPGARPGQAPTLMRTLPDGSKRPVKFDGVQGDYLVDRKWRVADAPRARAQLLRQSEVLAQHRLIGLWEVPTPAQKTKALRLFKKMKVTNIHVKVVKP